MHGKEAPTWLDLCGEERLEKEYSAFRRDVQAGKLPGVTKVSLPDEDLTCWRVKLEFLDGLTQAGMQLNADLERLKSQHGQAHGALLLEVSFPEAYPAEPFFLRIVRPRVKLYSVHVTEGGSVCLEALAACSGDNGWKPCRTVGSILQQLLREFVLPHEPSDQGELATAAGAQEEPQWPRWPLCIHTELGRGALQGYGLQEARAAFHRTAWLKGWAAAPPPAAAAATDGRLALLPPLPPHWEVSDALLAGQTVFVELPLPEQPGPAGWFGQARPRKEETDQCEVLAEAERVLRQFQAQRPGNARLVCIERVQSLELWHRYCRRRELVELESGLPDVQLFHGTSKDALELICRGGFDVRLANRQGSLGGGLYFGTSSSTSSSYCGKMFDRSAVQALSAPPGQAVPASANPPATPRFQPGCQAMLLCRVAVGKAGTAGPGARAPQAGCHSAAAYGSMHVVYLSDQAYPDYVLHFSS
ncbi:hypothetical protein ABPG75_000247 [Micractinium tetrahymenae]